MQDQMSSDFKLRSETSVFRVSCDRDNLAIQIVGESDKIAQLVRYGRDSQSKGNMTLIYVATPSDCKSLAEDMKPNADDQSPLRIRVYHGTGNSGTSLPSDAEYMGEEWLTISPPISPSYSPSSLLAGEEVPHPQPGGWDLWYFLPSQGGLGNEVPHPQPGALGVGITQNFV